MDLCISQHFSKPNYLLSGCVFVSALFLVNLERVAAANMATMTATSRSVLKEPDQFAGPGVGTVTVFYTTFDGLSTLMPLADSRPGSDVVSGEFLPRFREPLTYEADYLNYSSLFGIIFAYGFTSFTLPANDADGNTIPDIFQYDRSGTVDCTGLIQSDYPSVTKYPTRSTLTKKAGTRAVPITSSATLPDGTVQQGNSTFNVGYFSGSVTYTRSSQNSQNQLSCRLEGGFYDTKLATYTGSTSFSIVNANQISVPQFTATRTDGVTIQIYSFSLIRKGNRYTGEFEMSDGALGTYWRDYTKWVMEITDANDSDRNGVPDFSDVVAVPVVNVSTISSIIRKNQSVVITWTGGGSLQSAQLVTGPWVDVTGATSPRTNAIIGAKTFYRIKK